MRLLAAVAFLVLAGPGVAKEPPTVITLAEGGASQSFSGSSTGGVQANFNLTSLNNRKITFKLAGKEGSCGVEIQRSSQLGYMSKFDTLPTSRVIDAKQGEVFKVTFYQSRSAWLANEPCAFAFDVE